MHASIPSNPNTTTALPTPRTSHHGLGAYFIQPVGEQKPTVFSRAVVFSTPPFSILSRGMVGLFLIDGHYV